MNIAFLVLGICMSVFSNAIAAQHNGQVVSSEKFIPRDYNSLESEDKKFLSQTRYDSMKNWYLQCNDVDFQKITYMSDGLKVVGVTAVPNNCAPHEKRPVIIYNRGGVGNYGKIEVSTLHNYFYPMVKAGYIVIASQYRGNDGGEGKDTLGGDDVHDVLNLMDVIKQIPQADTTNIYMFGISRGGMMTYLALKNKMPIKAAAVCCGISDMNLFEQLRPDMKADLESFFSTDQKIRFSEYEKRSAINWAQELDVPLILFHAQDDRIVQVQHTLNLVQKLEEYHKVYRSVIYPNGGHSLAGNFDDIIAQTGSWFLRYRS